VLWLIHLVNKPFERRASNPHLQSDTLDEIAALASMARLGGLLGEHQERIIRGASRLSNLTTENVMIPTPEVAFLSNSLTLFDALIAAHNDPHTRFPVHEEDDCNKVLGYVNFKEMIYWSRTNPKDPGFRGIIRPVHFVKPTESAAQLLKVFVDQHEHMAIVQDNAGQTLGLITLEDLIEELVGELEDEFDRLPRMLHRLTNNVWMVGGGVVMSELAAQLQEPRLAEASTVAAYIMQHHGQRLKLGDRFTQHGWVFLIRRLRRGKVFEASVMPEGAQSGVIV
jgi:putative hemolysin